MKKRILMAVIGTFMLAFLGACSKGENQPEGQKAQGTDGTKNSESVSDAEPAWKSDNESGKLSWYVNADWWNTDYGNDVVTAQIKKDLKLDIEFQAGTDEVLNTKLASDEMPDLVTVFVGSPLIDQASQWALPLNDLADQYDPYFYKVVDGQVMDWYAINGKTYGYPSFYNTQKDYDEGVLYGIESFLVRKDIYEAIGSPDLSTPEAVIAAAEKAHELYPEVISLGGNAFGTGTGSWGHIFQNLIGTPVMADGKYYDRYSDPEYQRWLNTFAKIYRKGLISDEVFSDDDNLVSEKISSGRYFMFPTGGLPQIQVYLQNWFSANPDKQYIAVDGPRDSKGTEPMLEQQGLNGWSVTYVTKQCSNPKKAIELYTYMISDYGRMLTTYGNEGEHYTLDDKGMAVVNEEVSKLKNDDPERYNKELRFDDVWMFMIDSFRVRHGYVEETEAVQQPFAWSTKYLKSRFEVDSIEPKAGTAQYRNLTNINTKLATTILSMVRSSSDEEFNQLWQEFLKYRDSKGWEDIVAIMNENIKKNMEKLGE
jgi:putative aldouronate transport system substrate-binding protein